MRPVQFAVRAPVSDTVDPDFARDVLSGLAAAPKQLPSKWFYDATGSALFEQICEQPEYYLTRVELGIMQAHADAMAAALGPELRLVEFGSGAGTKTRLLLAALDRPAGYLPVEISESALADSVAGLRAAFPALPIQPVGSDFTLPFRLPVPLRRARRTAVYFPGSTLGNFDTTGAIRLLTTMRRLVGDDGAVLLGLDLKKDSAVLEAAYNDAAGVTARFTLNLLTRINRELRGDFELDGFGHRAVYNTLAGRIETQIVSRRAQRVAVLDRSFAFAAGEPIQVEISCKYARADLERLATRAGLAVREQWTDAEQRFGVFLLTPAG